MRNIELQRAILNALGAVYFSKGGYTFSTLEDMYSKCFDEKAIVETLAKEENVKAFKRYFYFLLGRKNSSLAAEREAFAAITKADFSTLSKASCRRFLVATLFYVESISDRAEMDRVVYTLRHRFEDSLKKPKKQPST